MVKCRDADELFRICKSVGIRYHGTDKKASEKILQKGFKAWTYFARDLQDSLAMGGDHVFRVTICDDGLSPDWWQTMDPKPICLDRIVELTRYDTEQLYVDEALQKRVFDRSIELEED